MDVVKWGWEYGQNPPIEKLTAWLLMSDEDMVDFGYASPEVIERVAQRQRESEARWRALPWRVRFARTHIWPRWREFTHRLGHAMRALRGEDCA